MQRILKWFQKEVEETHEETRVIDPEMDKVRREKFSKPLIPDDEEEVTVNVSSVQKEGTPPRAAKESVKYESGEVISPFFGRQVNAETAAKVTANRQVKETLPPVISPFFGVEPQSKEVEQIEVEVKKETSEPKAIAKEVQMDFFELEGIKEELDSFDELREWYEDEK